MAARFVIAMIGLFLIGIGDVDARAAKKCPPNSSLSLCGQIYEQSCDYPLYMYPDLPDYSGCEFECRCSMDYLRDGKTGECVQLEDCSYQTTEKNSLESIDY